MSEEQVNEVEMRLELGPELQHALYKAASDQGITINALVNSLLKGSVAQRNARHLRVMALEALNTLLVRGVPNDIPGIGFQGAMKADPQEVKKLPAKMRKEWKLVQQIEGQSVYMVPVWHLLWMADQYDINAPKPTPQPLEGKE
jgi:hypothetical protein